MMYVLSIDQSTQGTKAILVDVEGNILARADRAHEQIVNEQGWVSHNLDEIYRNTLLAAGDVIEKAGIDRSEIAAIGLSNQRETTALWNREGNPMGHAVVWQCARGRDIARGLENHADEIRARTGIPLSPYFPAAKMAWLLQNTPGLHQIPTEDLCLGTIDSWLVYKLTKGESFRTDYSNASRTQLFNITELRWDDGLLRLFGIPAQCLPEVCDSDSMFGRTDLEGLLPESVPICGVLGDSHAALFGQGCHSPGEVKTTYGTGSSIMMNTGEKRVDSRHGLITSLAWRISGKAQYVLEGNINYTGASITWLKDDVGLISSPGETNVAAMEANPVDETVLVPAFTGLSAPYWSDKARGILCNISRTTGKNEIIRAALDSIAYQINAIVEAMKRDSGLELAELHVDGGPTKNHYLMQLQSDLSHVNVIVPPAEELSALGAAYLAGISAGVFRTEQLFKRRDLTVYEVKMPEPERARRLARWDEAVQLAMKHTGKEE